jgi:hypothetical protein
MLHIKIIQSTIGVMVVLGVVGVVLVLRRPLEPTLLLLGLIHVRRLLALKVSVWVITRRVYLETYVLFMLL